jgi:hypothetical protein
MGDSRTCVLCHLPGSIAPADSQVKMSAPIDGCRVARLPLSRFECRSIRLQHSVRV